MKKFKPVLNKIYAYSEIKDNYGFDRSFAIWDKDDKEVCAFVLNPEMNPSLHYHQDTDTIKILVAKGPMREANLKKVSLDEPYPIFMKQDTNQWKFIGTYYFCGFTTNSSEVVPHVKNLEIKLDKIVCVMTLEKEAVYLKKLSDLNKAA